MSKHLGVQIIHCCNIYCHNINCVFVGYDKNKKKMHRICIKINEKTLLWAHDIYLGCHVLCGTI